ncbi:unnamed protein product [Haemonchus placei]|uniref:Uncharacterized protein n=1 Tax=Haemonchus placei TaxID=6290 RepID=A0A3P7WCL1_HAEPC|nr:unnamed protein product [Haemonchus placei]
MELSVRDREQRHIGCGTNVSIDTVGMFSDKEYVTKQLRLCGLQCGRRQRQLSHQSGSILGNISIEVDSMTVITSALTFLQYLHQRFEWIRERAHQTTKTMTVNDF